jgi:phosphoglycolate phosphatase
MADEQPATMQALVFDLDGTLIDSKMDLVNSVNVMLRETGRRELPTDLIASYVGHGAPQLMASALGPAATEAERREALAVFLKHYRQARADQGVPRCGRRTPSARGSGRANGRADQ